MPTYEYECKRCGFYFERFQKISDEPLKTCPGCGGIVWRLISGGSGIIFKGHGFYATDHTCGSTGLRCWTKPAARGTNDQSKQKTMESLNDVDDSC